MSTSFIEFENFSAYYKLKKDQYFQALVNLSFTIEKGELLVVVGSSGSGKTTLLRSLLSLIDTTDGRVLINGEDLDLIGQKERNFSYVSQEFSLYPNMTIFENIAFPLRAMHTGNDEVEERVTKAAEELGLTYLLTRKPKQLSGGQQQRVAIGRALIKTPRLILFDEPFSNVDPSLRVGLRQLVKQIQTKYKTTVLFVTHDLSEAFYLADRILVLEEGKIVEQGTPEGLETEHKSTLLKEFFKR